MLETFKDNVTIEPANDRVIHDSEISEILDTTSEHV